MMDIRRLAVIGMALVALLGPSAPAAADDKIIVASKIDTEGALLGSMVVALLRQHGYAVEDRLQLGPTKIVRTALLAGQIDLYPDYTGNGAFFFHSEADPVWTDATQGYERVRALDRAQNDLLWLTPAPVSNSWAIAIPQSLAMAENLATLEDFARYVRSGGRIKLAASAEFVESASGLPSFQKTYGFTLAQEQLLVLSGGDTAATIRAAAEHVSGVTAAMAYATDGAIATLGMVVLTDSKGAQIVYAPCLVARGALLRQHPELEALLQPAFATLSIDRLRQLNARISVDGEDPAMVAASYLHAEGLLP